MQFHHHTSVFYQKSSYWGDAVFPGTFICSSIFFKESYFPHYYKAIGSANSFALLNSKHGTVHRYYQKKGVYPLSHSSSFLDKKTI